MLKRKEKEQKSCTGLKGKRDNMHICFILGHVNPAGGSKVVLTLSDLLQKKGHRVTVAVKKLSDSQLSWLFPKSPKFELLKIRKVSKHCLPDSIDVLINFMDGDAFGPLPDVPHVLFLQGWGSQQYEREVLNLIYPFHALITTSKWLSTIAVQGGHTEIYIIPPGIDDRFRPMPVYRNGPITIGSLYHKAPDKNMDLFIASMNKLKQHIKNVNGLFLSASHPNLEKLPETTFDRSFVIRPQPHLLPFVYASTAIWVAPSINEGFGLTPLEAMACGISTVIVPSGGLDEYLQHKQNCMLVTNDKTDVVNAILELLNNDNLRNRIITNGKILSNQFSWQKCVNSFEKALFEIVK